MQPSAAGASKNPLMDTVIVLFNRDLRVHDHPALTAACATSCRVVPLFVVDPEMPAAHRAGFLSECLADLRRSLRELGGDLVVRRGDPVAETLRLAEELPAQAVYASADAARSRAAESAGSPRNAGGCGWIFAPFPG